MIRLFKKSTLTRMQAGIRNAFAKIKEELDDHRGAINDNSKEMNDIHDYLSTIDEKMEKLASRIDTIQVTLERSNIMEQPQMPSLSEMERNLLLMLYTNEEKHFKLQHLASRLKTTVSMLKTYVQEIAAKGIPVVQEVHHDSTYIWLDESFRERQAKLNVLGLGTGTRLAVP